MMKILSRRQQLSKILEKEAVDCIFISNRSNILYLTGYNGDESYLLFAKNGSMALITDFRYLEQAKEEAILSDKIEFIQYDHQNRPLGKAIDLWAKEMAIKKILFEEADLTFQVYRNILEDLVSCQISPAHNLIEYIRSFKDEDELACLAQAAAIADKAFALLLPEIKPNISEKQLAAKLIYYIYSCGGEELSFPSIIASGTNGAFCHAMPSDKLIADGDLITFDFGAVYRGYHSDMTRTLAVGKVNQKQKEIYSLVLEAQMAALDGLKAGLTGSQGDKLARDIIAAQGYGDNFGHSLGHGVGLEIHEYPNLAPSNNQKLAVNQVVTVEPGIYIPSWGGIRIEDTVIIKENGVEIINEFPKDLLIL